ncbi:MAG: carbohydrate binding domain-containing protein, partial [Fibrobacter sp.]|nr:carbohydrate binding domain-containing protein [Fibrobacter sp.]
HPEEDNVIKPGSAVQFQNFEDGSEFNRFGGFWSCFSDTNTGGKSQVFPQKPTEFIVRGVGNPGHAIQVNITADQVAGIETTLRRSGTVNLSNFESIIFDYKTIGNIDSMNFVLPTENITNLAYSYKSFPGSSMWNRITINIADLKRPNWSSADNTPDLKLCSRLRWEVIGPGKGGTVLLDNIALKLKEGLLPDEDLMELITSSDKKYTAKKNKPAVFDIVQTDRGLKIKSGKMIPSRVEMFNLGGTRVFQHELNVSNGNSVFVPFNGIKLTPGQYIVLLCDKPGSPSMMARKFILQ